jgi:hypothetical protein
MYREGRKVEAGDEEDEVQGIADEMGLGSVIPPTHPCTLCFRLSPRSTFSISLAPRR